MSQRRQLTDDLWLPEHDTAQTVQVGHSPLPFEESDCNLHVRITGMPLSQPRQSSIETMLVRRPKVELAPTVLLPAAQDPAEEEPAGDPSGLIDVAPDHSKLIFALVVVAISSLSLAAGVLLAPLLQ